MQIPKKLFPASGGKKLPALLFCIDSCYRSFPWCVFHIEWQLVLRLWLLTDVDEKRRAASGSLRARVNRDARRSVESCRLYRNPRSANHSCCSNLRDYDSSSGSVGFLELIRWTALSSLCPWVGLPSAAPHQTCPASSSASRAVPALRHHHR